MKINKMTNTQGTNSIFLNIKALEKGYVIG